ncbi:UNC93-like protein MFSD11 isoform X1 [Prionailurus iriomotensis]
MFMFTAFQTCGNVAQTDMAIIYGVFSASNLITPSVVAIVGPQLSMFASGLFYSMYIAVFIQPFAWSFYAASVFIGIAAAVLWTAQGNCLTINSDEHTIGRNTCSLEISTYILLGKGKLKYQSDCRTVFIALTVISLVGTVLFFLIRQPESENVLGEDESSDDQDLEVNESAQNTMAKAVDAFRKSLKLCVTREMLLLSITTAYTGLELTFFSGVYGTCVGAVNKFGTEEKSLIGLSGIFIGIGEILDTRGGVDEIIGQWRSKWISNPPSPALSSGAGPENPNLQIKSWSFWQPAGILKPTGYTTPKPPEEPTHPHKLWSGQKGGGSLFGLLSKNNRFGRNPVVLLGILVHFIAFYLIFLNMPGDAPIAPVEGTDSTAYISSSKEVAIFCSFLLGLGDSCFNTQLLSILGFLYSEDSAPAFAIFKFVQSICAAVAFFYSNYLLLHWQLLVMVIFGFFGTISFFSVEWDAAAIVARGSDYRSI